MREMDEGFGDVSWHLQVYFPALLVPFDGKSAVAFRFPVAQAFVIFSDHV